MRLLVCAFSSPGFLYPLLGAAQTARTIGHEVLFMSDPDAYPEVNASFGAEVGLGLRPFAADVREWGRPEAAMAQYLDTRNAISLFRPDLLVTNLLAIGALLAAEEADLPTVVLGLMRHLWPCGDETPEGPAWLRFAGVSRTYDLVRATCGFPRRRYGTDDFPLMGDCLALRSVPALDQHPHHRPARVVYVGPCLWEPPPEPIDQRTAARLARLRATRPTVYVQLAPVFGTERLWPTVLAAIEDGGAAAAINLARYNGEREPWPDNARLVAGHASTLLLGACDAVIATPTTTVTLAALCAGVPVFALPFGTEQSLNAEVLTRWRAGVVGDTAGDVASQWAGFIADRGFADGAVRAGSLLRQPPATTLIEACTRVFAGRPPAEAMESEGVGRSR